jgi:hypothetical protein
VPTGRHAPAGYAAAQGRARSGSGC